ncbi:hypothetical protein FOQG_08015 [Fusarium oxysporum f. sp. raphani 54005]|uniref:Uncharacterized protein n=3 Tax=Fusarium oxysporum TaxID=5507 RepID=X0D228_FUSOX|nr:hypothetical protein FOVG_05697 [Fusarium oxysporum f. sp. pisi HDV247]EXK88712.1 hypothetical protein FOQG_08015 [Fusarium oxysporum f. sp. raphani 54005]EXL75290.1 hypothetical protein FOPG_09776 [Fusarium oxysporum f. sp. conglutinans race 2 54008]KAJ0148640.1 hypothetical protein HZ326_8771 [Fusarium oxysporum f. sp. albedinis]
MPRLQSHGAANQVTPGRGPKECGACTNKPRGYAGTLPLPTWSKLNSPMPCSLMETKETWTWKSTTQCNTTERSLRRNGS